MASLCYITKEKNLSKNYTETKTLKLVPGLFVFAKNQAQLLLENEMFEATTRISYAWQNYKKIVKISIVNSSDSFLQGVP